MSCLLGLQRITKAVRVFLIGAARYSSISEIIRILLRNIVMQVHNIPFLALILYIYPSLEVPGFHTFLAV